MKPKIFLCHSKKDRRFIEKLANDLKGGRVDVWYDDWEIPSGKGLRRRIMKKGIPDCDLFFVYLTEAAARSPWVRDELDAAFVEEVEREGGFLALYTDSRTTRDSLDLDLKSRRVPVVDEASYGACLLDLVASAWENFNRPDMIRVGTGIAGTPYDFKVLFEPTTTRQVVVTAQNLRTLISNGFFEHVICLLEGECMVSVILTTYKAACAIAEDTAEHYVQTIRDLRKFMKKLSERNLADNFRLHFHPGATSLCTMIRLDRGREKLVFTPKYATDRDPDNRVFCVVDKQHDPHIYERLTAHLTYMQQPNGTTLDTVAEEVGVE